MLEAILLIISGCLAIPSLIIAKKPDAKSVLDKIVPYQGWIGLIMLIWGIWSLISVLGYASGNRYMIIWILMFITAIVEILLGFILSFNLLNKYLLSKNDTSQEKGQQFLAKLLPLQGKLGIAAIILGIVILVLLLLGQ
ncbi:hypothetical protein RHO15_07330 [Utexia brackfieldae]|uniref:hypothetical protein n=1 Tax=Utexia brackfieldae TaxID=3074108 RepID=UPI00370D3E76